MIKISTEALEERFRSLIDEGKQGTTPFTVLVLKWIHFMTEMIAIHNKKASEAAKGYRLNSGWPLWNDNDQIIPSLATSFKITLQEGRPKENLELVRSLEDLNFLFDLYLRYRDPSVRLFKLTDMPFSDFFTFADYHGRPTVEFLLNIPEESFNWLEEKTRQKHGEIFLKKGDLLASFKDGFMSQYNGNFPAIFTAIQEYPYALPKKETMYEWFLEKFPNIDTPKLEELTKITRSKTLGKTLLKRPDKELSFGVFMSKIADEKSDQ